MRKATFLIICFSILTTVQLATADYHITNGSETKNAWVAYSIWEPAGDGWPVGWRTEGWRKIAPDATEKLSVPANRKSVYIRIVRAVGIEIKPPDYETRDRSRFWIHPSKPFTAVETPKGKFLDGIPDKSSLKQAYFYKYPNEGSHTISDSTDHNLPYLPAQQIYNQAMSSVIWIGAFDNNDRLSKGSGVLIDKDRRLAVTNAHVIDNAESILVFFPYRDQNGRLNKKENFYFKNWRRLENQGYVALGQVIAQNVRNDLAIIQLDRLSPTAREINHDFSMQLDSKMRRGDKVHILGNPGGRLWNWTQGTFLKSWIDCLPNGGPCLEIEGDAEGGNSGGPVLNGQGMFIGILTAGTDETVALAAPARNVKALLDTLRLRYTFKIRNSTGVTVPYQIQWTYNQSWKNYSLRTGFIRTHPWNGENVPQGYPKIRFDYVADDGQQVTFRTYDIDTALSFQGNNDHAPTYFFRYNQRGNRLNLFRDAAAAPTLSRETPTETELLSNYPNPSNPETWIPYQLAKSADVTLTIYAVNGKVVRQLILGHQAAGVYQNRSRAAYWDGRNEVGESVASGVYFYTLAAGDFTATRKMLIKK